MTDIQYADFVRDRITELRMKKGVSEHGMSLELGKSGSYIRAITSGSALPSLRELFRIVSYLDITPAEFFAPLAAQDTLYHSICTKLSDLNDDDLEKVDTFIQWIQK